MFQNFSDLFHVLFRILAYRVVFKNRYSRSNTLEQKGPVKLLLAEVKMSIGRIGVFV